MRPQQIAQASDLKVPTYVGRVGQRLQPNMQAWHHIVAAEAQTYKVISCKIHKVTPLKRCGIR